jgi:phage repressor protein C with HTH and peptisase S24 domain
MSNTEMNIAVVEWLKSCAVYADRNHNKTALADYVGVTKQAVGKWFKTGLVSKTNLAKAAEFYGRPLPPIFQSKKQAQFPQVNAKFLGNIDSWDAETPLDDDEVELPYFREVELSAGNGRYHVVENHGNKLRFLKKNLKAAGVDVHAAYCVQVSGDSMSPVMPDKATVGIDTAKTKIADGGVYAIDHAGMLRIKILSRLPNGGLRLKSYNSEYHDELIKPEDAGDIRILGKVFWVSFLFT